VCKEFYHFARFELRIRKEVIKPNDIYIKKNTLLKQNQMEESLKIDNDSYYVLKIY